MIPNNKTHAPSAPNRIVLLAAAAFLGACTQSDAAQPVVAAPAAEQAFDAAASPAEPTLDAVRAATARFQDVNVALAEGYVREPMNLCDSAEMLGRPASEGVMGIHFMRPDRLGIAGPPEGRVTGNGLNTDFLQPSILIYEPQADGSLELVAVENLVFIEAWEAAGYRERPTFAGQPYNYMADDPATPVDEAHMFEPHYDLHVWLYRDNPNGMFAQFNPNATCEHHVQTVAHAH